MTKLKDFFNKILNSNRIFTAEDIGSMTSDEFKQNEEAIDYQSSTLGIPRNNQLKDNPEAIYVHSYTKNDGTKVKSHYRSRNSNMTTGLAANLTGIDNEFDRPLNYNVKDFDTGIPNLKNYWYYYNDLNNKLEKEVGDFLRDNTNSPDLYSNDIRHQFVSALYARNFGPKQAEKLGDMNERWSLGTTGSGKYDTDLDKLNNEIGRQYAIKYPHISREQLLQILLRDWQKNSDYTENILKKR